MEMPNTTIYRYIPFERFMELVFKSELTLVSPVKWADEYELYWLKLLDSPQGNILLQKHIQEILPQNQDAQENVLSLCKLLYSSAYCLCFSSEKDSEVMWNAHSDNKQCIMIAIKQESLLSLFDTNEIDATIKEVCYDLEDISLKSNFLSKFVFYPDGTILSDKDDFLLHKRKIFTYEKEIRLLAYYYDDTKDNLLPLHIPNLSHFIEGVMVHPSASPSYTSLIKAVCSHFKLAYWGKSSIYSFLNPFNSN